MCRIKDKLREALCIVFDFLTTLAEVFRKVRKFLPSGSITHNSDELFKLFKEFVVAKRSQLRLS